MKRINFYENIQIFILCLLFTIWKNKLEQKIIVKFGKPTIKCNTYHGSILIIFNKWSSSKRKTCNLLNIAHKSKYKSSQIVNDY